MEIEGEKYDNVHIQSHLCVSVRERELKREIKRYRER